MNQLLLSLAQLALAIVLSAVAAYLAFYLFQAATRGLDEAEALRAGNPAVGLVLGAVVVAVAVILRPALVVDTESWDAGSYLLAKTLLAEAIQLAVALIIAVMTIALSLLVFSGLTRGLDEIKELEAGNLAVAALLAGVVIGVSLIVSHSTAQVLSQLSRLLF